MIQRRWGRGRKQPLPSCILDPEYDSLEQDIFALLRQIECAGHITMEDIEELTND